MVYDLWQFSDLFLGEGNLSTLQGTNISPKNGILKMIFLFPRWDMLIPWRVSFCFMGWAASNLDHQKLQWTGLVASVFSSLAGAATRAVADRRGSSRTLGVEIITVGWFVEIRARKTHVGMVLKPCKSWVKNYQPQQVNAGFLKHQQFVTIVSDSVTTV